VLGSSFKKAACVKSPNDRQSRLSLMLFPADSGVEGDGNDNAIEGACMDRGDEFLLGSCVDRNPGGRKSSRMRYRSDLSSSDSDRRRLRVSLSLVQRWVKQYIEARFPSRGASAFTVMTSVLNETRGRLKPVLMPANSALREG
jgi:hypothetical protein